MCVHLNIYPKKPKEHSGMYVCLWRGTPTILVSSSPWPASETPYNPIVLTDFQIAVH